MHRWFASLENPPHERYPCPSGDHRFLARGKGVRWTRGVGSISALAVAASLLLAHVHVFGDAGLFRAQAVQAPIPKHVSIPPDARAILDNKCADCHSAQAHAPIYGHFAPISWLMERDILEGRTHMNLSQWDNYSADQQQTFESKIVQETKSHDMPLLQYQLIHWDKRVTDADVRVFSQWARRSSTPADATIQTTADGDPIRGAALFDKRCTGCHSLTTNREGPMLQGVYGRTTGSVLAFSYSPALKDAHIEWNDQMLDEWLSDPDAFIPGNNMDFLVARPQERKDLIAFFKQKAGK
jgi:cytochrome c